ncbi:transcriptional regulator family: C2H2 zinc finger [Penicillium roqueforti]|nr:transcriptional regulator family: C2H2 zinc finger [Penicillium roqueforti]KAI3104553.1 transcriptional regulator family: C2H2 zinc finger [Penicillium roqueforti]
MYDSDDAFNRSPPLEAMKPNYGESETLPPFVSASEKEADAEGSRKPNQLKPQNSTREGDRVLMEYLAPHHPEIAAAARISPLEPLPGNLKNHKQPPDFDPRDSKRLNSSAKEGQPKPELKAAPGPVSGSASHKSKPPRRRSLPFKPIQPDNKVKDEFVPRERLQSLSGSVQRPQQVLPHLKTPPEREPQIPLPSLKLIQSSSGSCLAKSPDSNKQTLPSIHKALSALSDFGAPTVNTMSSPFPFSCPGSSTSGNDSPFDRTFPGKFSIPASPFSHFSPVSMKDSPTNPSPASHSSFWRGPPHSEMLSVQSPYEASPMTAQNPATSYPTPTEQVGASMGDRHSLAASTPQANGPLGSYRCTHSGCTAAPFQTQYLLNSHANVHSQDRPHFCPVEGCPRALGGKGFKRKNEMMRHGLVHNSPGYVCPFCPDQQHKYPRPDNLQRHVRVHHVDKNKDDPILRQVLAQRPLGSTRGRKRRMNNT